MDIESFKQAGSYMKEIYNWEQYAISLKVKITTNQEERVELADILAKMVDDYVGRKIKDLNKKIELL